MSASCILIQLAAVCRKSWKRKSEICTPRHARRNASETFSGLIESAENTCSVGFTLSRGTAESPWCAKLLRYTIRPSPFFVCGSRMRPPFRSTSSHRSPRIADNARSKKIVRCLVSTERRAQSNSILAIIKQLQFLNCVLAPLRMSVLLAWSSRLWFYLCCGTLRAVATDAARKLVSVIRINLRVVPGPRNRYVPVFC